MPLPTTQNPGTAATPALAHRRSTTLLPALAAAWSGLAALLGSLWWATGTYPFGPDDPQGEGTLLGLLPSAAGPPLLAGAGVLGVVVALLARRRHVPTALVAGTAAGYGVVFLLLAPGLSLLVLAGYLMAALGPVVLLVTLLAGARRSRLAALVTGALVLVAAVAWTTGLADGEVVANWASAFGAGLVRTAPRMLALLFLAAGGALWVGVGWTAVRAARPGGAAPGWTRPDRAARWGLVATVVATLCALPYVLVRATWLTPWPLGLPQGADLSIDPAMRLQGLLLGGAALAGAVLTTGLVARWGEVWPRWMPALRGRPVPVAAAVVPGTVVSVLLCSAAQPMAMMAVQSGDPLFLLLFPLPVWGPALGAATLAYALRRRGGRERPGTIEGP